MIRYVQGNILNSNSQVLVNPVNTVGIMGAGLAKQFKEKYPKMFAYYKSMCDVGAFSVGEILWYRADDQDIANFPTKENWRTGSDLSYIEDGLNALRNDCYLYDVESIAMPKLGCGLGGLEWEDVRALIEKYFADTTIDVEVYV